MAYATTRRTRPSLMDRLRPRRKAARTTRHHHAPAATATTTTTTKKTTHHHGATTAAPAHHHQRRPSMGDKVSGAMMKLRGSLTHKPGLKAAGTRRMHGTDGRHAHTTTTRRY